MTNVEIRNKILTNCLEKEIDFHFHNSDSFEFNFHDENGDIGYSLYLWTDETITISDNHTKIVIKAENVTDVIMRNEYFKIYMGEQIIRIPING